MLSRELADHFRMLRMGLRPFTAVNQQFFAGLTEGKVGDSYRQLFRDKGKPLFSAMVLSDKMLMPACKTVGGGK